MTNRAPWVAGTPAPCVGGHPLTSKQCSELHSLLQQQLAPLPSVVMNRLPQATINVEMVRVVLDVEHIAEVRERRPDKRFLALRARAYNY